MTEKLNRYKEMERNMLIAIALDVLMFIGYLIASGVGIIWLKVLLTVLVLLLSVAILAFLYLTQELLKPRSLWMSAAAVGIIICTLFSLILNFPCPPYVI